MGWSDYIRNLKTRHNHNYPYKSTRKAYNSILDVIGDTPLVKLTKIPKEHGLECDIYAKCEFFNPAGSIKDRIAHAMIDDAVHVGAVHKNSVFVEPTSGNTGIGVVFTASILGNKSVIVLSEKNSDEKVNTMRLLGAHVVQIKTSQSDIEIAEKIKENNMNAFTMVSQFENEKNPQTHYNKTGQEILDALDVPVDMVVMGAGTGGTMSGVGHRLKDANPDCVVVAAEPAGSTLFNTKAKSHPFLVEGLSMGDVPMVLDKSVVNSYEVVTDEEAFLMARELCNKEGLLCGGSSGLATAAAVKAAKHLKKGQCVVVILPDGIRNYMTKFVSDQWMEAYRFLTPPKYDTFEWWNKPVTELGLKELVTMPTTATIEEACKLLKDNKVEHGAVLDDQGYLVGVVSINAFRNYATNPTVMPGENVKPLDFKNHASDYLVKHIYKLGTNHKKGMPTVGLASRVLDIANFVVVGKIIDAELDTFQPVSIYTAADVFEFIRKYS